MKNKIGKENEVTLSLFPLPPFCPVVLLAPFTLLIMTFACNDKKKLIYWSQLKTV